MHPYDLPLSLRIASGWYAMSRRWQPEDLTLEMRARIVDSPHQPVSPKGPVHKFGARECFADNQRFDSKLEMDCYHRLKILRAAGAIRYFTRRPVFQLPGGVKHVVDFMVVIAGREPIFGDAKGYDYPTGKLKRKQVADLYGVDIQLWKKPEGIVV